MATSSPVRCRGVLPHVDTASTASVAPRSVAQYFSADMRTTAIVLTRSHAHGFNSTIGVAFTSARNDQSRHGRTDICSALTCRYATARDAGIATNQDYSVG